MKHHVYIVSFFIAYLISVINAINNEEKDPFQHKERLDKQWEYVLGSRKIFGNQEILFKNSSDDAAISSSCKSELTAFENGLKERQLWALKMADASSKIPSGILEGNLIDLGMYDECLAVHGVWSDIDVYGRHCMYKIGFNITGIMVKGTLSTCLPASCTVKDIMIFLNQTISRIPSRYTQNVTLGGVTCSRDEPSELDTESIVYLVIFGILVGFLLVCTVCGEYCKMTDSTGSYLETLSQFSLIKNGAAILSTERKKGNLPYIQGLRFFSMSWVVLGHQFLYAFSLTPNVNAAHVLEWIQSWKSLYIFTAPYAVDTFFTVSGFLMTYLFLKEMSKKPNFNIPMYYIHRYLRLTPSVLVVIIIAVVFVPNIGSGPLWEQSTAYSIHFCRKKWWSTLLYIQNFKEKEQMCLPHLWYLAVDMQLFWFSPIILYPLYKMPKIGLWFLSGLLHVSMIIPAYIIAVNEYRMVSFTSGRGLAGTLFGEAMQNVYMVPHTRATPWLIGIFLGYEIVNHNRRLTKRIVFAGWLLTCVFFTFCILGTRYFMDPEYEYSVVEETLFWVSTKLFWGLAIAWIIFSCVYKQAGLISSVLSWSFLLPLSRLSYCVYLVHFVIQSMQVGMVRLPGYFSNYFTWCSYFSSYTISIIVAFLLSLLFESPLIVLEKMLLRRK
ncbi:hypothetical protein QAD02_009942 [Eretmocerus hayati]|uniref:Uncharacterized protein n=1 Tax=Eretmocerus hayati TaxID=131215 RepID=A0ACC2NB52_9HYME|nr:hypothetical protein QAD02_009942 [Eretmocerus hayati]